MALVHGGLFAALVESLREHPGNCFFHGHVLAVISSLCAEKTIAEMFVNNLGGINVVLQCVESRFRTCFTHVCTESSFCTQ